MCGWLLFNLKRKIIKISFMVFGTSPEMCAVTKYSRSRLRYAAFPSHIARDIKFRSENRLMRASTSFAVVVAVVVVVVIVVCPFVGIGTWRVRKREATYCAQRRIIGAATGSQDRCYSSCACLPINNLRKIWPSRLFVASIFRCAWILLFDNKLLIFLFYWFSLICLKLVDAIKEKRSDDRMFRITHACWLTRPCIEFSSRVSFHLLSTERSQRITDYVQSFQFRFLRTGKICFPPARKRNEKTKRKTTETKHMK